MSNRSSERVPQKRTAPPLVRYMGVEHIVVPDDVSGEAGTADPGQVRLDPIVWDGLPLPIALLVRDWGTLRAALENAAVALHAMTCDVSIRLARCPNPMCVYRVGLLDRTGGSVPHAAL